MRIRLVAPTRTGLASSLRIYPVKIRGALRSAGVEDVAIDTIEMGAEATRGGVLRPTLHVLLGRLPRDGTVWHAAEPNSALRGVDVVTIHDFHAFENPGVMMRAFRLVTRVASRRARRIVVETEVVRTDVRRHLGDAAAAKTRIVPPPYRAPPAGRLAERYDVLWVGSAVRRKHPERFLHELAQLTSRRLRVAFVCHPGGEGLDAEVRAAAEPVHRAHDLSVTTADVPTEELDRLYRSSRTMVSTSSLEGYHVPIFEAWSRGTWVILPRIPLYSEIYGTTVGVRFYDPSLGFGTELQQALGLPPFEPDPGLLTSVSDPAVGRRLLGIYREARPDLAAPHDPSGRDTA